MGPVNPIQPPTPLVKHYTVDHFDGVQYIFEGRELQPTPNDVNRTIVIEVKKSACDAAQKETPKYLQIATFILGLTMLIAIVVMTSVAAVAIYVPSPSLWPIFDAVTALLLTLILPTASLGLLAVINYHPSANQNRIYIPLDNKGYPLKII